MSFLTGSPIYQLLNGNISFQDFLVDLLCLLPALVIAVSFHEAAHAWMANKMGDPTARNLGRITLDPTKHFDVWGFLMLIFVGFGWGKPVPTNPRNYYNYKKGNVLVALAGVITNIILSFVFFGIAFFIYRYNSVLYILYGADNGNILLAILGNIVILNLILFFFNMIPIPPLDGHHLIKGFIAKRSQKFYMLYQNYGIFLLIGLLVFTNYIQIALFYLVNWITYLYTLFFGLFV
jgi:Zn-dependent protease